MSNFQGKAEYPFVFVLCQHGTEPIIKDLFHSLAKSTDSEVAGEFRFAFSPPGFLTFKFTNRQANPDVLMEKIAWLKRQATGWAIRLAGYSLEQVKAAEWGAMRETLAIWCQEIGADGIHVFERDQGIPGDKGFEVGRSVLAEDIADRLRQSGLNPGVAINQPAEVGQQVLDVILIEPGHWLIGCHRVAAVEDSWVGGSYIVPAKDVISRAYYKMAEAVAWAQFPIEAGDEVVEIGSSPGGASQRLLDLGLRVTGVDPAEMDERLLQNPNFEHWRGKAAAFKRKRFRGFKWLAIDANVAPNYTLAVVEDLVTHNSTNFRGLLLTIKLSNYRLTENLEEVCQRVRSWGFARVKVRQLSCNRRECCVAALR